MTLEVLKKEMINAMKAKNKVRKDVISSLVAAVQKTAIDEKCRDNITEELVNRVILKEKKTMQDMINTCPADRVEILEEYKTKMSVIEEFVPKMMSEEEIRTEIKSVVDSLETINKGLIMKTIAPKLKGKADMGLVNKIVSEFVK